MGRLGASSPSKSSTSMIEYSVVGAGDGGRSRCGSTPSPSLLSELICDDVCTSAVVRYGESSTEFSLYEKCWLLGYSWVKEWPTRWCLLNCACSVRADPDARRWCSGIGRWGELHVFLEYLLIGLFCEDTKEVEGPESWLDMVVDWKQVLLSNNYDAASNDPVIASPSSPSPSPSYRHTTHRCLHIFFIRSYVFRVPLH